MCTCSHGCPASPTTRDNLAGIPLRHRLAYNPDGTGVHGGQRPELFGGSFLHLVCERVARDIDAYSRWAGGPPVDWIGNVGVTVCKSGMHGVGRAFDLTRVQMRDRAVDCNTSWRTDRPIAVRRRYLAVVAVCRTHAGTVLTSWYNAAHGNHIHFDDGVPFTRLRPGMRSDTTLVQAAANLLIGAGLAVEGCGVPEPRQRTGTYGAGCGWPATIPRPAAPTPAASWPTSRCTASPTKRSESWRRRRGRVTPRRR